ncbi:MAG: hypothetical protein ACO3MV_02845 [Flavobacteriales bacterium]
MKKNFSFILMFASIVHGEFHAQQSRALANYLINLGSDTEEVSLSTPIASLDASTIASIAETNSCYLPLLEDRSFFHPNQNRTYQVEDLYNQQLPEDHPYRNRYLVGDLNALDENGKGRGISEINPNPSLLQELRGVGEDVMALMHSAYKDSESVGKILALLPNYLEGESLALAENFITQVWKYHSPPLKRTIGTHRATYYEVGQTLNVCEVYPDTLILVAKFATSSKRMDYKLIQQDDSTEVKEMFQYLPIGPKRKYYASKYTITSKNWERQRTYGELDAKRDELVGGGHNRIAHYQGKTELPNFLTMTPDPEFSRCLKNNGIHEVSLSELSRGMLGCANSLGCIRVSDFASKFLRWWTPQDANFFVCYQDERYFKKIDATSIPDLIPFKNEIEGNAFRLWVNQQYPVLAEQLKLDSTGSHDNGYIFDAFQLLGEEYESIMKQGKASPESKNQ